MRLIVRIFNNWATHHSRDGPFLNYSSHQREDLRGDPEISFCYHRSDFQVKGEDTYECDLPSHRRGCRWVRGCLFPVFIVTHFNSLTLAFPFLFLFNKLNNEPEWRSVDCSKTMMGSSYSTINMVRIILSCLWKMIQQKQWLSVLCWCNWILHQMILGQKLLSYDSKLFNNQPGPCIILSRLHKTIQPKQCFWP